MRVRLMRVSPPIAPAWRTALRTWHNWTIQCPCTWILNWAPLRPMVAPLRTAPSAVALTPP